MTQSYQRYRHQKRYKVTHWIYDRTLVRRGDINLWITDFEVDIQVSASLEVFIKANGLGSIGLGSHDFISP